MKILKHSVIPYFQNGKYWIINPLSGSLLSSPNNFTTAEQKIPLRVKTGIEYCNSPYTLSSNFEINRHCSIDGFIKSKLKTYDARLEKIGSNRFFISQLYCGFTDPIFVNTAQALNAIYSINMHSSNRHKLCFRRTLLVAKTSKTFIQHGVLFIGAFLPTTDMHAWIIEDGLQPDSKDAGWINYRPLLAIYF